MIKRLFIVIAVSAALICMLISVLNKPTQAQEQAGYPAISKKLDDILNGQKSIAQSLDSIQEELKIIKIRITQQQ